MVDLCIRAYVGHDREPYKSGCTVEPIKAPFGVWTREANHASEGSADLRHTANTIECSVHGGDAALL